MALEIAITSLPDEIIRVIRGYVDLNRFDKRELSKRFNQKPTEWFEYENGLVLLPAITGGYSNNQKEWIRDEFPLYQAIAYICEDCQGNIDPFLKNCDFVRHQTIDMIQNQSYDHLNIYNDNFDDNALFLLDKAEYFDETLDLTQERQAIINNADTRMEQLTAYWNTL